MKRVCIKKTPVDLNEEFVEVESVTAYLQTKLKLDYFPVAGRIYHNIMTPECDVTPHDEESEVRLEQLEGDFYVVVGATEPITIATWIFYAVVAATAAFSIYMYMTMPKPSSQGNMGSSNNELSNRSNQMRLGSRAPEIFGTVRGYPDLIAVVYSYYVDGIEIEECLMVLGKGYHLIHDCKDGTTNAEGIDGISVSIYDPGIRINGNQTIYKVGEDFTVLPLAVRNSESINGQSLVKPNDLKIESDQIYFESNGWIKTNDPSIDFAETFKKYSGIMLSGAKFGIEDGVLSGSAVAKKSEILTVRSSNDIVNFSGYKGIVLTGATFEHITKTVIENGDGTTSIQTRRVYRDLSGQYTVSKVSRVVDGEQFIYVITLVNASLVNYNWSFVTEDHEINAGITLNKNASSMDLDGTYSIKSVSKNQIELTNAELVNSDWLNLGLFSGSTQGRQVDVDLDSVDNKWVGWFDIQFDQATHLTCNFYAPQGMYSTTDKGKEREAGCTIRLEYQNLDKDGLPIGDIHFKDYAIWAQTKSSFGRTLKITLPQKGSVRFRLAKISEKTNNRPITEVKIKSVYASYVSTKATYPDLTVLRVKTVATDGALSVKERKLNCLVTRKLPIDGTGELVTTRDAGQALIYLALDDKNGRRTVDEVDIEQIKAEIQAVKEYFDSDKAAEFCYTIDDANLSFEEIAGMIASAVFCEPYRFGSKLRLKFEKPQEIATLLFNHRNKVPQTEIRTRTQLIDKDYDGLELEYTDPSDDARIKYYIWYDINTDQAYEGEGARNPITIKTTGIRNHEQAKTRAWREWNKLQYRRITTQFEALDESNLLARNDKILVADNCSLRTQDGEVNAVNGLVLTLSQDVVMDDKDCKVYLQMPDKTVDIIACTKVDDYRIALARPPKYAVIVDHDRSLHTVYQILAANDSKTNAFMLTEMSLASRLTNNITAVNYDDRYYEKDHSFF